MAPNRHALILPTLMVGYFWPGRRNGCVTVRVDGRTEGVSGLARVEVDREVADLNFSHPQRLPFWTFVLSHNSHVAALFVRA